MPPEVVHLIGYARVELVLALIIANALLSSWLVWDRLDVRFRRRIPPPGFAPVVHLDD